MKTLLINCYYYLVARICKKYQFSYANKIPSLSSYETVMVRQFLYACLMGIIMLFAVSIFLIMEELQSRKYGTVPFLHWYSLFLLSLIMLMRDKAEENRSKLLLEEYSSPANTEYYILFSRVMTPDVAKKKPIKVFVNSVYDYFEHNELKINGKTFKCINGKFCKIDRKGITEIEYSSLSKYASDYRNGNLLK